MTQETYILTDMTDDDGNYTFGKTFVSRSLSSCIDEIVKRASDFKAKHQDLIDDDDWLDVSRTTAAKYINRDGYICYVVGDGSGDIRRLFRVIMLTNTVGVGSFTVQNLQDLKKKKRGKPYVQEF